MHLGQADSRKNENMKVRGFRKRNEMQEALKMLKNGNQKLGMYDSS